VQGLTEKKGEKRNMQAISNQEALAAVFGPFQCFTVPYPLIKSNVGPILTVHVEVQGEQVRLPASIDIFATTLPDFYYQLITSYHDSRYIDVLRALQEMEISDLIAAVAEGRIYLDITDPAAIEEYRRDIRDSIEEAIRLKRIFKKALSALEQDYPGLTWHNALLYEAKLGLEKQYPGFNLQNALSPIPPNFGDVLAAIRSADAEIQYGIKHRFRVGTEVARYGNFILFELRKQLAWESDAMIPYYALFLERSSHGLLEIGLIGSLENDRSGVRQRALLSCLAMRHIIDFLTWLLGKNSFSQYQAKRALSIIENYKTTCAACSDALQELR
jgi:hypothetical protein